MAILRWPSITTACSVAPKASWGSLRDLLALLDVALGKEEDLLGRVDLAHLGVGVGVAAVVEEPRAVATDRRIDHLSLLATHL